MPGPPLFPIQRGRKVTVEGVQVLLVHWDALPASHLHAGSWDCFVFAERPVNVYPFRTRAEAVWWLRSDEGRQAVREAVSAGGEV